MATGRDLVNLNWPAAQQIQLYTLARLEPEFRNKTPLPASRNPQYSRDWPDNTIRTAQSHTFSPHSIERYARTPIELSGAAAITN
jgi:hypothetical protein